MPKFHALLPTCCIALAALFTSAAVHAAAVDDAQALWAAGKRDQAECCSVAGSRGEPVPARHREPHLGPFGPDAAGEALAHQRPALDQQHRGLLRGRLGPPGTGRAGSRSDARLPCIGSLQETGFGRASTRRGKD